MIDSVQKLGGTARNITVYPQIAEGVRTLSWT